jgi:hypothetical protein
MNLRRTLVLISIFFFCLALIGWQWYQGNNPPETFPNFQPHVTVEVVSDKVMFNLFDEQGKPLPKGLPVRLNLSTSAGPFIKTSETTGGSLILEFPYVRAGLTPYLITIGRKQLEGSFYKHPGLPVTPLTPKVGARAVRVTGDHEPALVIHPLDMQKNVSLSLVTVKAIYPQGNIWERVLRVNHLIAWSYIPYGQEVGKLEVIARSENAVGEQGEVDLLPGVANQAQLNVNVSRLKASQRESWQLMLSDTQDVLGNLVNDGTAVTFLGGNEDVHFYVTRPLIQGSQPLMMPAISETGSYVVSAFSGNFRSDEVTLEILPMMTRLPMTWTSISPLTLELGPVMDEKGALVDNGTLVSLTFYSSEGEILKFNEVIENGMLQWHLPAVPKDAVRLVVKVAGVEQEIALPTL